jgi:two-component sensor histidine kinase
LSEFIGNSAFYAFAGFIDTSGLMECLSDGEPFDFSSSEDLAMHLERPRSFFSFQSSGAVTGRSVILANRPVYDDDQLIGYMTISISRHTFNQIAIEPDPDNAPKQTYLVNYAGEVLTNTDEQRVAELLPHRQALLDFVGHRNGVFSAQSENGSERMFTIAEVIPGQLYALGSWNIDQFQKDTMFNIWRLAFPVLMWVASIAVVMFAMNFMVVRHLKHINSQLRRFAVGNRAELQRLPYDAPSELKEIDSTFSKMARIIQRDEQEREVALNEKTVLLKEVHHRVKNNLQLIASILNLQMRRVSDTEARAILHGVQTRVRSLASIHRALYQQERIAKGYAANFFDSILGETLTIAQIDSSKIAIDKTLEPVALSPDKIIPAALLFAEALTNALKYAGAASADSPARLEISLTSIDGYAVLRIWNSLPETSTEKLGTGLGQELMTAFALQINGEIEVGPKEADGLKGWEVRLRVAEEVPAKSPAS